MGRSRSAIRFCFFIIIALSVGCGRYAPPVAPELLAPDEVQALKVSGTSEGVDFAWNASKADQRGKDLKTMDGYRLYRKQIAKSADIVDSDVPFELVTTLEDKHVAALKEAQDAARAAGRPSHRAKVDSTLTVFSYKDTSVAAGQTYVYKVVPVNQGGVESDSFQLVKVLWRGDSSEINTVDTSTLSVEGEFGNEDRE